MSPLTSVSASRIDQLPDRYERNDCETAYGVSTLIGAASY